MNDDIGEWLFCVVIGVVIGIVAMFMFYGAITESPGKNNILIDCQEIADSFNNNQTNVSLERSSICYDEYPELFYKGIIDGLQNDIVNIITILNRARGEA